jgi:hypothetical protein
MPIKQQLMPFTSLPRAEIMTRFQNPRNPMKNIYRFLLALGLAVHSAIAAQTVINATQDSYIQDGSSADSVLSGNLQVSNRGSGFNRKTYLEIDLSSAIPTEQKIGTATLKLTLAVFSPSNSTEDSTFNVYGIIDNNDTWDQSTLTWNNATKNDTASSNGVSTTGTVLLGTVTFNPSTLGVNNTITFSSAGLANYLNWAAGLNGDFYSSGITSDTDKKVTIILTSVSATSPAVSVYNLEGTGIAGRKPQLEATFVSSIPEPSTVGVLAGLAGLTCAALYRRRR